MAEFFNKIINWFKIDEPDQQDDEFDPDYIEPSGKDKKIKDINRNPKNESPRDKRDKDGSIKRVVAPTDDFSASKSAYSERVGPGSPSYKRPASSQDMPAEKGLHVVKPTRIEDVSGIIDSIMFGNITVINLNGVDSAVTQRIIDMVFAVNYAIKGEYKQVDDYNYIISKDDSIPLSGDFLSKVHEGIGLGVSNKYSY